MRTARLVSSEGLGPSGFDGKNGRLVFKRSPTDRTDIVRICVVVFDCTLYLGKINDFQNLKTHQTENFAGPAVNAHTRIQMNLGKISSPSTAISFLQNPRYVITTRVQTNS